MGVVVNNVQTVLNIARAVEQHYPVTRRTLTINGAVARPQTVTVPIGMSLRDVLEMAGGATIDDPGFINGGPMMGSLVTSLDAPVTKTTGGLLVLPKTHPLIQRRMQDERTVLSVARTVCEQCRLCTDLARGISSVTSSLRICWCAQLISIRPPRHSCCSAPSPVLNVTSVKVWPAR